MPTSDPASASHLFGDSPGDAIADRKIRSVASSMATSAATAINAALEQLMAIDAAIRLNEPTAGRPSVLWSATAGEEQALQTDLAMEWPRRGNLTPLSHF
jgi:hypothetical protein